MKRFSRLVLLLLNHDGPAERSHWLCVDTEDVSSSELHLMSALIFILRPIRLIT